MCQETPYLSMLLVGGQRSSFPPMQDELETVDASVRSAEQASQSASNLSASSTTTTTSSSQANTGAGGALSKSAAKSGNGNSYAASNSQLQRVSKATNPENMTPSRRGNLLSARNEDLVRSLEDLRANRDEVDRLIQENEEELDELAAEIEALQERYRQLNDYLERRKETRSQYDKTIEETNQAYNKLLESSQNLLSVLKQEGANLSRDSTGINLDERCAESIGNRLYTSAFWLFCLRKILDMDLLVIAYHVFALQVSGPPRCRQLILRGQGRVTKCIKRKCWCNMLCVMSSAKLTLLCSLFL